MSNSKTVQVYLAGACRGLPDEGRLWRHNVIVDFSKSYGYTDKKIIALDPTRFFARDGSDMVSNKQVKNYYMKTLIKNSDLVLVNLDNTANSVGTGCELQYAECHEIPIVGFGGTDCYEWLPEYCDVIFKDLDEALEYIKEKY